MIAAIGFTLFWKGLWKRYTRANAALSNALSYFPDIKKRSLEIGESTLVIWGRGNLEESIHVLPDGSYLALVGSPVGELSWNTVETQLMRGQRLEDFRLPWDGRVVLVHISADGKSWLLWNDWLGSIPVFYTNFSHWRIASTLEPVVVAANDFNSEDIYLSGLLLLLKFGNYLADWTLFKDMHTIPPDSVVVFDELGYRPSFCKTIAITDERRERGWNDLVEEMHALANKAITIVLKMKPKWIVPLSSGLDSRLIASIAAENGCDIHTYTYGPGTTRDGVNAHKIARVLDLPWKQIKLDNDYLVRFQPVWVDLFGSSMHFHGMYQISFLETLRDIAQMSIISGFIGECLSGVEVRNLVEHYQPVKRYYSFSYSTDVFWEISELKKMFRFSITEVLEEIADMIEEQKNMFEGPWYQTMHFASLWGRQNHFTYYQSMLADYFRGVATPYINRDYANFCMSLPRAALDDRRLQIDMMRRYYPKVMCIGGTYAKDPALLSGRYLLKRRMAEKLPLSVVKRLLPEFTATKSLKTDIQSLRACGKTATWPIDENKSMLSEWIDVKQVESAYEKALEGDLVSVRKIQSIQAFAYRLNGNQQLAYPGGRV